MEVNSHRAAHQHKSVDFSKLSYHSLINSFRRHICSNELRKTADGPSTPTNWASEPPSTDRNKLADHTDRHRWHDVSTITARLPVQPATARPRHHESTSKRTRLARTVNSRPLPQLARAEGGSSDSGVIDGLHARAGIEVKSRLQAQIGCIHGQAG